MTLLNFTLYLHTVLLSYGRQIREIVARSKVKQSKQCVAVSTSLASPLRETQMSYEFTQAGVRIPSLPIAEALQ